jgi:phosphatidate phosphatase LPIN
MNVVGRVGSLITQGVYSVATPFHPFGGAVDIIAVKQQDGSFRSTPWYVRFGKFQGVLKGAEKIVRIEVNGVEADFHMYLDASGEAYFIREVKDTKAKDSGNLEGILEDRSDENGSVSNTDGEVYLQDERISLGVNRLDRAESDAGRPFYDFQDDESSLDGSVELPDYDSGRYENLDDEENIVESENSNSKSEVILVSVDGHMLMAPILSSEGNNDEDVQLGIPQFHLGPGEGPDFREGNAEFDEYLSNLSTSSTSKDVSENTLEHRSQDSEVNGNDLSQQETQIPNQDLQESPKMENGTLSRATTDIFKSCLELQELDIVQSSNQPKGADEAEKSNMSESENREVSSPSIPDGPNSTISQDIQVETENIETNTMDDNQNFLSFTDRQEAEEETDANGLKSSSRFEISLCGNALYIGMGLLAAAEAFDSHRISEEEFKQNASSIIKNENLIIKFQERYLLWEKAKPIVLGKLVYGMDLELPVDPEDAIRVEPDEIQKPREEDSRMTSSPSGRRWRLWPNPFRRAKTLEHTSSNNSTDDVFAESEASPRSKIESPRKQFLRTNVPTTEQIASLKLNEGQNLITFSYSTKMLGKQTVEAHMYLWRWNARIVISDVDGTITKSDVLGQVMPLVGKDWSQSGVARLFCAIKENGYQLLFLSARAIVQAYLTKSFLVNLKQDGKALPRGPVVISPDGLFPSLYREVIRRAPHEFKIACLEDIKALFPADYNPFYAGFGNRDTDELSYRKIGIPKGKIFIINPKGEVAISHCIDSKSYTSLHTLVNDMFPPTSMLEQVQEDYNSWNYWRVPIPDIDDL